MSFPFNPLALLAQGFYPQQQMPMQMRPMQMQPMQMQGDYGFYGYSPFGAVPMNQLPPPAFMQRMQRRRARRGGGNAEESDDGVETGYGDDDDDDFGDDEEEYGAEEDESEFGADDEISELQAAMPIADGYGGVSFGDAEGRAKKKLARFKAKRQKYQLKAAQTSSKTLGKIYNKKIQKLNVEISKLEKVLGAKEGEKAVVRATGQAVQGGASVAAAQQLARGNGAPNGGTRNYVTTGVPGGAGRLERLQLYPYSALATDWTGATSLPIATATVPAGGLTATQVFQTAQIPWAIFRILGFMTSVRSARSDGADIVVQDLKAGGGANLFMDESWQLASNYDEANEQVPGLRDCPVVRAPNTIQVSAAAQGDNTDIVKFSCSIIIETLEDTISPSGGMNRFNPGPYAR